jgi:hypothetical protein
MSLHGCDLGKQEPGRRAGLSGAGIANGSAGGPVVCVVTGGEAGAGWQAGWRQAFLAKYYIVRRLLVRISDF